MSNFYKCTVDGYMNNGIWEVKTDTKDTLKIERVEDEPFFTSYGREEKNYTIKKDNYASKKINKDGSRTLSRHCYKYVNEDLFYLYPDRQGIPYEFEKIEAQNG